MAQSDCFLDIDGVEGESVDDKYKGKIDVLGWGWGGTQSGTSHIGGGGGTGKVSYQDLNFQMYMNKATPDILRKLSNGKHFDKATLICRKAGETPVEYLKIEMEHVIITSYQTGGSGSGGDTRPVDSVSLNFRKHKMTYAAQKDDGTPDGEVVFGWDIGANVET